MKRILRRAAAGAAMVLIAGTLQAQSIRSLIREGNAHYRDEKYTDAEVSYRKALEKEKALVQGHFNLGNALHKEGKFDEAMKEYEDALGKAEERDTKAFAYYNIGNSQLRGQKYQDAVKSYVDALKIRPDDADAKYNLSYALDKLRQQQQQQQQQNKNPDKNKNKDQNQQKKNDQDKKDEQKKQDQPQPRQNQQKEMSKAEAERILDVLKNSEKDVQRKLRARQAVRPKTDKDW